MDYEVGVDDKGKFQYLNANIYSDYGVGGNEKMIPELILHITGLYNSETFKLSGNGVQTDTHANTWCRAPGECISVDQCNNNKV